MPKIPKYVYDDFFNLTKIESIENSYYAAKGSNNWVVSGNFTKSGKPLLANDPHLDIYIPSIWY